MTTFSQIIVKCPHCGTLVRDFELMSYTVHNSENFSDGFCIGPPSSEAINICPECNGTFWKEDCKQERAEDDWELMESLPGTMDVNDLPWRFDDDHLEKKIAWYKDLIEADFAKTDWQESFLRTQLWWLINDLIRHLAGWNVARNPRQFFQIFKHRRQSLQLFDDHQPFFRENLKRLIYLYIKDHDPDLIYLANMYREMGNFKKAKYVLLESEKQSGKLISRLKKKIRCRDSKVFKL